MLRDSWRGEQSDRRQREQIDPSSVSHSTPLQSDRLLAVLDTFSECFSEKPDLCTLVEHEIVMSPEFIPRRARAYKVAESYVA